MFNHSSRALQGFGLLRLRFSPQHRASSAVYGGSGGVFSKLISSPPKPTSHPPQNPTFLLFRSNFTSKSNPQKLAVVNKPKPNSGLGQGLGLGPLGRLRIPDLRSAKKAMFEKPAFAVTSAFSRYREAIGLQVDAFFKRNSLFLFGVGAVLACTLLWRIMFGTASTFVGTALFGNEI